MREERIAAYPAVFMRLGMGGRFPTQFGADPACVYAKHDQIGFTAIEVVGDFKQLMARRAVDEALALQRWRAVIPAKFHASAQAEPVVMW